MREQYGVLFPRFWEGTTGRQLQEKGRDAVILAAYLASCRHANMIGLYELPLEFLSLELKVLRSEAFVLKAFHELQVVDYATYDLDTQHVWVREMARIRVGLEPGECINPGDNKHKAILKLYAAARPNPFLGPFFERYATTLRLAAGRIGPPLRPVRDALQGASKGALQGFRAPRKPVQVHVQQHVQVQESESRSPSEKAAASPRGSDSDANRISVDAITAVVAKEILPVLGANADYTDLKEATKERCGRLGVPYDGESVGKALDSALHRLKLKAVPA